MSIKSIQYILKYVNKGCDMVVFGVQGPSSSERITIYSRLDATSV